MFQEPSAREAECSAGAWLVNPWKQEEKPFLLQSLCSILYSQSSTCASWHRRKYLKGLDHLSQIGKEEELRIGRQPVNNLHRQEGDEMWCRRIPWDGVFQVEKTVAVKTQRQEINRWDVTAGGTLWMKKTRWGYEVREEKEGETLQDLHRGHPRILHPRQPLQGVEQRGVMIYLKRVTVLGVVRVNS